MATFYVDATEGDDSERGRSPYLPWQTIAKVNAATLGPGDRVLFKRGQKWRETVYLWPNSGDPGNPIIVGAYGEGELPVICGADSVLGEAEDWTDQGGNVWRRNVGPTEPRNVIFDWVTPGNDVMGVVASPPAAKYEWEYSDPNLEVYAVGNPTTYYRSIEISQRSRCLYVNSQSWLTFEDLHLYGDNTAAFGAYALGSTEVRGITLNRLTFGNGGDPAYGGIRVLMDGRHDLENRRLFDIKIRDCATLSEKGSFRILYAEGVTIQDCVVAAKGLGDYILVDFSDGVSITGCEGPGVRLQHTSNAYVGHNALVSPDCDMAVNIETHSSNTHDVVVEHNLMKGQVSAGLWSGNLDPYKLSGLVVRYNWIEDCGRGIEAPGDHVVGGIKIWRGHEDVSIHHNIIVNCGYLAPPLSAAAGIECSAYNTVVPMDNIEIYNNVVYNFKLQPGIMVMDGDNLNVTNLGVKNNIVVSDGAPCIKFGADTLAEATNEIDNNLYCRTDSGVLALIDTVEYTAAQWENYKTASGQEANSQTPSDPAFVKPDDSDFHLHSGSPCRDNGADVGLTQDYDGVSIPQETNPVIGASEYVP